MTLKWTQINCVLINALYVIAIFSNSRGQDTSSSHSSSYGNDFYIGFMPTSSSLAGIRLTIGTISSSTVECTYEYPGGVQESVQVTASSPMSIDLSSNLIVSDSSFSNRQKGVHIYTPNEEEIFVLAESNFLTEFHGVFLAYPQQQSESGLTSYEYYVVSGDSHSDEHDSQILIVGRERDTMISISASQQIVIPENLQSSTSSDVTLQPGETREGLVIHEMQTLLIKNADDLTGTKIISDKPLTVISGHECASVPASFAGCEPFAVQVPPTLTWGSSFLLPPFAGRTSGTVHRILTSEKTAVVHYSCGGSVMNMTIDPLSHFEFTSNEYCYLDSSNSILVVQQASSGLIDNVGDPAVALVAPTDQYVNSVSFLTLPTDTFPAAYISVIVPVEHFEASNILLNGQVIVCSWVMIHDDLDIAGYGCSVSLSGLITQAQDYIQHTVSHTQANGLLSVIVYGINLESGYAYLAGQELLFNRIDLQRFSYSFPSSLTSIHSFPEEQRDIFKQIIVNATNSYCTENQCFLVSSTGEIQSFSPVSTEHVHLIVPSESGGELLEVYIEAQSCYLKQENLEKAITHNQRLFQDAGFLPEPSTPDLIIYIAVALAACLLLIVIVSGVIIALVCCLKKRNRSKLEMAAVSPFQTAPNNNEEDHIYDEIPENTEQLYERMDDNIQNNPSYKSGDENRGVPFYEVQSGKTIVSSSQVQVRYENMQDQPRVYYQNTERGQSVHPYQNVRGSNSPRGYQNVARDPDIKDLDYEDVNN